jgi:hypothetical protein
MDVRVPRVVQNYLEYWLGKVSKERSIANALNYWKGIGASGGVPEERMKEELAKLAHGK